MESPPGPETMEAPHSGRTPRRPALRDHPRSDCCQHPERHRDRDPYGWWRHDLPDHVAEMITRARQRAGLSKHRAARDIGIGRGYLQHLEQGARAPSVERAYRIADVLDLTPDELDLLLEYAVTDAGASGPWGDR